jgi:hypothetical protein
MPRRGAGGMRKRDHVLDAPVAMKLPAPADNARQRIECEELGDRDPADRKDKARPEDFELALQPMRACLDLLPVRHTVPTARIFAGKAPADRREVDPVACRLLVPSKCGLDPAEKCLACCPGEESPELRLPDARGLSDQKDAACDRSADDDRLVHGGASFAAGQSAKMSAQGVHDQPKRSDAIR